MMRKVQAKCKVCEKYRRRASKPKVSLPKARETNEVVSIDLKPVASITKKEHDQRHIVYMVCEFSRLTAGDISKNKEAENLQ